MRERRHVVIAVAMAVVLLLAILGAVRLLSPATEPVATGDPVFALTVVDLQSAPADVREAALALRSSRVAYPMVKPDRTYLIISTGSDDLKVRLGGFRAQPASGLPSFVDVDLSQNASGDRLLLLSTPMTGGIEYQFNLGGVNAAIPTLYNPHGLRLTHLDEAVGFTLLTPQRGAMIASASLSVQGYARAFESRFHVMVTTEKGRVLGAADVSAAAGYPNWGSFSATITLDTTALPETGLLILSEPMTGSRMVIPIRFRSAQLG